MSPTRTATRAWRLGEGRELRVSIGIALVVLLLVGVGASFAARWVAQHQSIEESERRTARLAQALEPRLSEFLAGVDGAEEILAEDLNARISPDDLTEITVWSPDGTVLFGNNASEIGARAPVEKELARAIQTGKTASDIQTGAPEADEASGQYAEGAPSRYVEVYQPAKVEGYGSVVFEAYYDYDRVESLSSSLFWLLLPLALIPLLVLQAIQLPIAASLTRRVRRHEKERAELAENALEISDRERVRFAADLHDGPIQDLAGIGYALGVISPTVSDGHRRLMSRVEEALQRSVASLRSLMTDLYPPDLVTGSLDSAIESLTHQLVADGVRVQVSLAETPPLPEEVLDALYRVARESLANVGKHANAAAVDITLEMVGRGAGDRVRLTITDDGDGVDLKALDKRAEGHLGLRLIQDRVRGLGGTLAIDRRAAGGTIVTAELPLSR